MSENIHLGDYVDRGHFIDLYLITDEDVGPSAPVYRAEVRNNQKQQFPLIYSADTLSALGQKIDEALREIGDDS